MQLAMVQSADRHGELIADLATEGSGLGEAKVMRLGRQAAADQARLLRNELSMLRIA